MQIILLESLNKLGKAGEVVSVKDGYANNFLIPEKKAIVANKKNKENLEERMVEISANNQKKIDEAESFKLKLDGTIVEIAAEANDEGALYGAISHKHIIESLLEKKIIIKPDMIVLPTIKSIGEFEIKIIHYEDVSSTIKINVIKKT